MNKFFTRLTVMLIAITLISAGLVIHSKANSTGEETSKMRIQAIPGGTLFPSAVTKYADPLVKPPAMPGKFKKNKDKYKIAVRQFQQQILPDSHPMTTVWSYGSIDHPGTPFEGGTFFYPAFTIEATHGKTVQVQWRNELVDSRGNYLSHILPVDQTLHWANPPGGIAGRDTAPTFASTPGFYTGPVPMITHVHGAHTYEQFDGYPEAWYLPNAKNIPAGYATTGTFYDHFNAKYGQNWSPGTATFRYPNDQRATTLWYHDHTLGMTRVNVYAGPAGFYLIRGGADDLDLGYVAPGVGDSPFGHYTEIPLAIQDRSFNVDGSLFYPANRAFFDGFAGPYIPNTPVPPIWNPEFFGNMMVVNGRTWPYLDVEPRRYRLRFLNGCNSRFLVLRLVTDADAVDNGIDDGNWTNKTNEFWQIGSEGGFLDAPKNLDQLLMAPAERADVIIDFSAYAGETIYLVNVGPDAPFGGLPVDPSELADPASTGQVMKFIVGTTPVTDNTTHPSSLTLPAITPLPAATVTRQVSLNEEMYEPADVPAAALLGTYDSATGTNTPLLWMDPITENPAVNAVEEWEIYNFTEDAHPIHIHLIMFRVLGRGVNGTTPPEAWETGWKDTVIAYPGEITRIKARFDVQGLYVWHCHIVEHEDNEMMRPYAVGAYTMPAGVMLRRLK